MPSDRNAIDRRDDLPVLGICGFSGSGKTTLIEAVVPRLQAKGLSVAVIKHDAHGVEVDRPGKDSDRFFQAGADVLLQGPGQEFLRTHGTSDLHGRLGALAERYDLVLVEGHKQTPLPKLWLLADREQHAPPEVRGILAPLPRGAGRPAALMDLLDVWLRRRWLKTPLLGCVLIGGKSTRMGRPKHLLRRGGRTWLERTVESLRQVTRGVVLAGGGQVPQALAHLVRLPDVPDASGPLAGILSAMRWAPRASWLVAACDLPNLSAEALRWLVSFRAPGTWAVLPKLPLSAGIEPLLAYYDLRAGPLLRQMAGAGNFKPAEIARSPKVICPAPPERLAPAWRNVNTQADLGANLHGALGA